MLKQLSHDEFKHYQKQNKNSIIFILENLEHSENIGSAFRLADAFNIEELIVLSDDDLNFSKIKKTARNCENTCKFSICKSFDEVLQIVNVYGYHLFALEITNHSRPLRDVDFAQYKGIALIVGNERFGVSEEVLQKVPDNIHIDMYGNNSSLNVCAALAIATYKISEDCL